MKTYNSFLVRCWRIKDSAQAGRIVFDIEHIQTGNRLRARSLIEACDWMMTVLTTRLNDDARQDDELNTPPSDDAAL